MQHLGHRHAGPTLEARGCAATSDVRKSTNWANERHSTNNEVASGEQRRRATRWRATSCGRNNGQSATGDERRRRAAWWRAASREAAVHSGVPNKPMVLTATGVRWIARPAVAAAHRRAVRPRASGSGVAGFLFTLKVELALQSGDLRATGLWRIESPVSDCGDERRVADFACGAVGLRRRCDGQWASSSG